MRNPLIATTVEVIRVRRPILLSVAALLLSLSAFPHCAAPQVPLVKTVGPVEFAKAPHDPIQIELGERPFALLDLLSPGLLRSELEACRDTPVTKRRFSIGHRGAPRGYPEHTREGYLAAAAMGAGTLECDVTFTSDEVLVCRHSQCDLATTTNILETPLAETCREAFSPAIIDSSTGKLLRPAQAKCCTSEITGAEFQQLEGRVDIVDRRAEQLSDFLDASASWRDDIQATHGELMTHAESIQLFRSLGVEMTPELKAPEVEMPWRGNFTQEAYAGAMIQEYRDAGVPAEVVHPQSFSLKDVRFWLRETPEFGRNATWPDDRKSYAVTPTPDYFESLAAEGLRTLSPPIPVLLTLDENRAIVATQYAKRARAAGLDLVTWTLERSGRIDSGMIEGGHKDFYLGPLLPALDNEGDLYRVVDALYREAGVRKIFSDWPAIPTYYANCLDLP